jgi:dihydroflavonol-4-reductase
MKIFVTGGTGFIGTHVVRRLSKKGHELSCLVRETSDTSVLEQLGASLVRGDVTDKESVLRGVGGCEWVVNLANLFEFWVPDRRAYHAVNVEGTRNVMEAAKSAGAAKVVHISTLAVYGNAARPVTEDSELGPECFSEYARSKRAGELLVRELHAEGGLPLVTLYPGGVVGPDDPKAAGRYLRNLLRGKMPAQVLTESVFPWVYVGDVADAVARALEKEGNIGERYLLAAENLTFGEVNRLVSEISGVKLPWLTLPDFMTMAGAYVATAIAGVVRKPPILDMSVDQLSLMGQGLQADGSKAVKELGLTYTPIRAAIEEAIESFRAKESKSHKT